MRFTERLHMLHRCFRYRFRTERHELRYLISATPRNAIALDVGANRGIYCYWLSKAVGFGGRVVGFEPQPETAEYAQDFCQKLDNVVIESTAVGDVSREGQLRRRAPHDGQAQMLGFGGSRGWSTTSPQVIDTSVITLDEYCDENHLQPVRIIKIDTEGYELHVLRGAERILSEDRPKLLFECSEDMAIEGSLFQYLADLKFDGFFFSNGTRIHYSKFSEHSYGKPGKFNRNYVFEPIDQTDR